MEKGSWAVCGYDEANEQRPTMVLSAVQNTSLSDQIYVQLGTEILTGRYGPGTNLPSERQLCDVFGVNRHAVREALKRLSQAGLVKITQGDKTQVLDFKRHAGLDLMAMLAQYAAPGGENSKYWVDVLEMRAAVAADVVRLCALRASPEIRAEIARIPDQMLSAAPEQLFDLEVRFWDLLLEGCGNLAYRLAFNSMVKGALAIGEPAKQWSIAEIRLSGYRVSLAAAIVAGDAERAESETRTLMRSLLAPLTAVMRPSVAAASAR
jgi:DNA-binding FadR family transcriptional regulator